ncbi:MAG TPA: hypothetical protein VM555_08635 [Tahibacter sp.]|jgi:hypothetical protein|nr:hypothetical protein [Tahibacter sp.]
MTRTLARTLPLALVALLAACGSDQQEAAKTADVATKPQTPAQPLPANPTPRGTPVSNQDYTGPAPKPGDMAAVRKVGVPECDQFIEKARQCINTGVLTTEQRRGAIREIEKGIGATIMKPGNSDKLEACLSMQASVQAKLVSAGCQNF